MKLNKKVVIPVVLIGTGIGLYFLNKAGKLDKLKALFNKKNDLITPIAPPITPPIAPPTNIILTNPFTKSQLLAFQKWVNLTYKPTIPLVEDGIWGTKSAAAYNTYGTTYANKELNTTSTTILKIGDKVNAIKDAKTYSGYTLANPYLYGANNEGVYKTGNYVGVVTQLTGNAVKVSRASKPTPQIYGTFENTDVPNFWVRATDLEKSLI